MTRSSRPALEPPETMMSKKAFLVGVNRYHIPGIDLRGCVNDVTEMRAVLGDLYGFDEDDIMVLTDFDATKANIQRGLRDLVEGARPGDVRYFHFSGHGSNVPDQDGDEADGRDEIFCPTDLDWGDPLRDDWIREVLDTLAEGVNLTFVSDCCHSGTITRAPASPDADRIERFLPCPRDLWAVESGRSLAGSVRSLRRSRQRRMASTEVVEADLAEVLITACRADEKSKDARFGDRYFGALTHALITTLREGEDRPTCRQVHERVRQRLARDWFEQTPQLEGRPELLDRPFLAPFG